MGYTVRATFRNLSGRLGTVVPLTVNCWRVTIYLAGNDVNLNGADCQGMTPNGRIVLGGHPPVNGQVVNIQQRIEVFCKTNVQTRAALVVEEYLDPV